MRLKIHYHFLVLLSLAFLLFCVSFFYFTSLQKLVNEETIKWTERK